MYVERSPITLFLKNNLKMSIKEALELFQKENSSNIPTRNEIYRFTRGHVRYPFVEKYFLDLGIPQEAINKTFENYSKNKVAK